MCVVPAPANLFGSRQVSEGLFTQKDGKMLLEPEPSFRRWTTSSGQSPSQEPVPGLQDVLTAVGLASYVMLAAGWCVQSGAAFLSEIIEDEDTFADFWTTLGCPESDRFKQLKRAIITQVHTDSSTEDELEEQPCISWNSFSSQQEVNLDLYSHYHSELGHDMRSAFTTKLSSELQNQVVDAFNSHDVSHSGVISYEGIELIVQSFGFELLPEETQHIRSKHGDLRGKIDAVGADREGEDLGTSGIELDSLCAVITFKYFKNLQQGHSTQESDQGRW